MSSLEGVDYNYLNTLNPQQRDAVVYTDGPQLVIAGAGSGKTRVLTYKVVDLLRKGYEPYRILALTFTNKAAREMKERIREIVGEKVAARLRMGTFHSVFLNILRRHPVETGFKSGFTIYDTSDSKSLLKMIVKDLGLDEKIYKPATLLAVISNAKNAMIDPEKYMQDRDNYERDKRAKRPLTGEIFKIYCERCKIANAMDFDDILFHMNMLLRDNPDICRHYQEFFKYILVDEYQDTNFAQHLIISQLAGEDKKICVVGDDAQSIYSFRGADINNILSLEKWFPGLRIFKLERNYRSTQTIINAAGSLIAKNTKQMKKNVFSENSVGTRIPIVKTYSDMEEAYMVANMISQSKFTYHDSYDNYAVLYRTNAQSRILEESLRKRNIPYRIYGALSFYQRKEVKDVIAYFRLTINPSDDEALRRIINYPPRGIGETTLKKLSAFATSNSLSLWDTINGDRIKEVGFNSGTINKLIGFRNMIQEFIVDNSNGSDAYSLAQLIYNRTGILVHLAHDTTPESISRQENLSEILGGLKEFVDIREQTGEGDKSMSSFLSEVMLATDQDEKQNDNEPKVTLMTVHAAKGLEFSHIYVVGVEEELFPAAMSSETLSGVEEERRLLYVAITRAKDTCTLTYASSRFRNGQQVLTSPSRFLGDINPEYVDLQYSGNYNETSYISPNDDRVSIVNSSIHHTKSRYTSDLVNSRRLKRVASLTASSSDAQPQHRLSDLNIDDVINHDRFGKGRIIKKGLTSGEETITVDFGVIGIKRLLLKFAKFTVNN